MPQNPLHPLFEWDDQIAANRYRIRQARAVIASVREVDEDGVRAFIELGPEGFTSTEGLTPDDLRKAEEYARSSGDRNEIADVRAVRRYLEAKAGRPL